MIGSGQDSSRDGNFQLWPLLDKAVSPSLPCHGQEINWRTWRNARHKFDLGSEFIEWKADVQRYVCQVGPQRF